MEFEVGDRVMLKVLAKVEVVAYRKELPQELSRVHHTFHVSNPKKCYAEEPIAMPLEGIHVDDKLQFVEEPFEIMEQKIKRLKRSQIPLVKVRWNGFAGTLGEVSDGVIHLPYLDIFTIHRGLPTKKRVWFDFSVTLVEFHHSLPPLPPSLYVPPPVDRRDDIPESELPPRKRSCLSTLGPRYEVGESSTARPTGGRGIDYGFVSTVDAEARRRGIREVGYGIRGTWVDPVEEVSEIAPMTVREVNTRVTELAELHEHDTHDLYALLEDAQDSRTHISQ
ncbi:hypothetical protein Tco_0530515 [Tanacetum coccineum]